MSLAVAIKAPEGLVLAADSRVTYTQVNDIPDPENKGQKVKLVVPITYDNATKLLSFDSHNYVGAVTYDAAEIGDRTASSYIPEFLADIGAYKKANKTKNNRLTVEKFATELSNFFKKRWDTANINQQNVNNNNMRFIVGGFDIDDPYAKLYEFAIPSSPKPVLLSKNEFNVFWAGQKDIANRIFNGIDQTLELSLKTELKISEDQNKKFDEVKNKFALPIIIRTLALQDCVTLALTIIRTTIDLQTLAFTSRTVGGNIDIATITKEDGFTFVQRKEIKGEVEK